MSKDTSMRPGGGRFGEQQGGGSYFEEIRGELGNPGSNNSINAGIRVSCSKHVVAVKLIITCPPFNSGARLTLSVFYDVMLLFPLSVSSKHFGFPRVFRALLPIG